MNKTCHRHGELPPSQIRKEKSKSYACGYQLKCRFCDREKNKRQYQKIRPEKRSSWGENKDYCSIHGDLEKKDIVIIQEERNATGYQISCIKCALADEGIKPVKQLDPNQLNETSRAQ